MHILSGTRAQMGCVHDLRKCAPGLSRSKAII